MRDTADAAGRVPVPRAREEGKNSAMSFFTGLFKKQPDLQESIIDMKLAGKQMASASKKCEKNATKQKGLIKKAIEKGNVEGARIYAENAIREQKQAMQYLRMQARVDAVAGRLDTALRTNQMSEAMGRVVQGMGTSLSAMDVEKISSTMDAFETQLENLDVKTSYMEVARYFVGRRGRRRRRARIASSRRRTRRETTAAALADAPHDSWSGVVPASCAAAAAAALAVAPHGSWSPFPMLPCRPSHHTICGALTPYRLRCRARRLGSPLGSWVRRRARLAPGRDGQHDRVAHARGRRQPPAARGRGRARPRHRVRD